MNLIRSWFGSGQLCDMIERDSSGSDIAQFLDDLAPERRLREVLAVTGSQVGRLFELVAKGEPLRLEDLVPPTTPAGATITLEGRNSLPAFSRFRKRFTRSADDLVFGYNDQPSRVATHVSGPGYFMVFSDDTKYPGELLFDYTTAPPFEPIGWPPYRSNREGLARLVFGDLHDFVRRVTKGVVVGSAFKLGEDQRQYFTLTAPR